LDFAPSDPFGFAWIFLEILVRIGTFQWVIGLIVREEIFSPLTTSRRRKIPREKEKEKFDCHDCLAIDDPRHTNTNSVYPKEFGGAFG
jgi:hypothetical protein